MRWLRSCLVLLAFLLFCGAAEARVFKIATAVPDGLEFMKKVRAAIARIEEQSEGRVEFKIYPGGVQGDDQTVLRKIRVGQLQGGMVAAGTLTDFFPDLQVYNLPLGFRDFDEVDYVRERMDSVITQGLEDAGVITFGLTETGFAYILSNSPIRSISDLDTIKAWVPDNDPTAQILVRSFGISPIPLKFGDVLAGLQTGLIDAVASPPVVVIAMQWHTRVKYMTEMPLMYIFSMLMLDAKAFDRISKEDQALVHRELGQVFKEIDQGNRRDNREAYDALVTQGIEVVRPSAGELKEWRARAKKSVDDLVRRGGLSRGIVDRFNGYLDEYRAARSEQSEAEVH